MSIEKHHSILLSAMPYRESSMILTLYAEQFGRISAIAKGIRRGDRRSFPLERGYVIEHMLYVKAHRDLHLITDCHLCCHYPSIRGSLEKTAVRDLLFDVLLSALRSSDPNPGLFTIIVNFLDALDAGNDNHAGLLLHTARTLLLLVNNFGFSLEVEKCARCGVLFCEDSAAVLETGDGILACSRCNKAPAPAHEFIAAPGVWLLAQSVPPKKSLVTVSETLHLVQVLLSFCRCHLDIRRTLDSYLFVQQLFDSGAFVQAPATPLVPDQFTTSTFPYKEFSCYNHP